MLHRRCIYTGIAQSLHILRSSNCQPCMKMSRAHGTLPLLTMASSYENQMDMLSGKSFLHARFAHFRTKSCKPKEVQPWKREKSMGRLVKARSKILGQLNTQDFVQKGGKQGNKFEEKGAKNHHFQKRKNRSRSARKAQCLVKIVMSALNVKEEIYGALDEWVAFEQEFPLVAVKEAVKYLNLQGEWKRIIQVSKWMLSKGQGRTFSTYDIMLKAYDMDGRLEEADALWKKRIIKYTRSVPRAIFRRMITMYDKHAMPEKSLKVFAQMEKVYVKPDQCIVRRVAHIYEKMEMKEKMEELSYKYLQKVRVQRRLAGSPLKIGEDIGNLNSICGVPSNKGSGRFEHFNLNGCCGVPSNKCSDRYEDFTKLIIQTM